MKFKNKANLIIYRFRKAGLEVFLVKDSDKWSIPQGEFQDEKPEELVEEERLIELDPVEEDGAKTEAWAVEGEWHDIPSLKQMLYQDAIFVKGKIKENLDKGAYISFKEAVKKVLPHQYKFLKELKDILTDRNSIKDL